MTDHGPTPYVVDLEEATIKNTGYHTPLWTGSNLQLTVMSIGPGEAIELGAPDAHDRFLRIEAGTARVEMGPAKDQLTYDRTVGDGWAVIVPASTWCNLTNTGDTPLQFCSIWATPTLKSEEPENP